MRNARKLEIKFYYSKPFEAGCNCEVLYLLKIWFELAKRDRLDAELGQLRGAAILGS